MRVAQSLWGLLAEGREAAVFRFALDFCLPRVCALCGVALLPGERLAGKGHNAPLCEACARALVPITGPRCDGCGKALISETARCMRCRGQEYAFDEALPLFRYSGKAAELIRAYKTKGRRSLAPFIAAFVAATLTERWPGLPIVPVPPRKAKFRARGWDQVALLARELERGGFTVCRLLERRSSAEQKRLDRPARFANAAAAYRLKPGSCVPARLVLFDDVYTTGATAEACARALKSGGATWVAVLALAAD